MSVPYLLERSLYVNALTPWGWWIGQAFPRIPPARDVDALLTQVLEGSRHDADTVVGQSSGVLEKANQTREQQGDI